MTAGRPEAPELAAIREAVGRVTQSRAELNAAVSTARAAGYSWVDIARVLGVTRQAAWERFHRLADEDTDR